MTTMAKQIKRTIGRNELQMHEIINRFDSGFRKEYRDVVLRMAEKGEVVGRMNDDGYIFYSNK